MTNALLPQRPSRLISSRSMPPCVLHVEDDADFSAALKRRLEAHGVAVVRAFDGQDGIRQSQQFETDAVLIDLEMPNANGDEVLTALRANENTKHIPVIVLTGRKDRQLQQRMAELGASAYLTKPLSFDELREQLARYIDILPQPSLEP
ncbi:MAG: response regulator [Planctomycetes bacterium]|nr:response regulator [Planctomycetota bacterium]